MKYKLDIVVNQPLDKVIELFDNTDNLYKWQKGLVSFDHVSGEPGKKNAVSKLKYKMGKRDIDMTETIEEMNLPSNFTAKYEAKGVTNWVKNTFEAVGENQTKWTAYNEFKLTGGIKLFGWLFPKKFKKQSYRIMEDFKRFAEEN